VVIVTYQHPSVLTPSLRKAALIQTFKKTAAHTSCIKNNGTVISTRDYAVDRSRIFNAGSARHSRNLNHQLGRASKVIKHWADLFF
jgi:hypothetical protein